MKKVFQINEASAATDSAILLLRVGLGVLMLVHGVPKMAGLFAAGPVQFPPVLGMSAGMSLFLAVLAEVACSVLLILGLGTRLAAVPLIVTMLVAVLVVHAADPFNMKELGLHYLLGYVVLLITGSGRYSVDAALVKKYAAAAVLRKAA